MSTAHLNAARECKKFSGNTRLLLYILADRASDGVQRKEGVTPEPFGWLFAGSGRLMADLNTTARSTLVHAMAELVEARVVKRDRRRGSSSRTFVDLEALQGLAYSPEEVVAFKKIANPNWVEREEVEEVEPNTTSEEEAPTDKLHALVESFYKRTGGIPKPGDIACLNSLIKKYGEDRVEDVLAYNTRAGYWAQKNDKGTPLLYSISWIERTNKKGTINWDLLASTYDRDMKVEAAMAQVTQTEPPVPDDDLVGGGFFYEPVETIDDAPPKVNTKMKPTNPVPPPPPPPPPTVPERSVPKVNCADCGSVSAPHICPIAASREEAQKLAKQVAERAEQAEHNRNEWLAWQKAQEDAKLELQAQEAAKKKLKQEESAREMAEYQRKQADAKARVTPAHTALAQDLMELVPPKKEAHKKYRVESWAVKFAYPDSPPLHELSYLIELAKANVEFTAALRNEEGAAADYLIEHRHELEPVDDINAYADLQ